mmetsp:Transcript_42657/g.106755  ORF Transcript_42657/g.106755 Transcript_42657/m.106755 type:complete len:969 (+) Transcript_42657:207-3113(+)
MADQSTLSKTGGVKRPTAEDKPELHPGRKLCYYFKKQHTFLKDQVMNGSIRYDTELEIHVERCITERHDAMSLRKSKYDKEHATPNVEYDRYEANVTLLKDEVEQNMCQSETDAPMWVVKVEVNDRKRCLPPKNAPEDKRKPRLGAFEVILSWKPTPESSYVEVVLFSKLNTQRFPHPTDLVKSLLATLAPARSTKFRLIARHVPTGKAEEGAVIRAVLETTSEEFPSEGGVVRANTHGFVEPLLPFGPFTATATNSNPLVKDGDPVERQGMAQFEVHGDLNKCICIAVGEPMTDGEVRVVLTWAEFPHSVVLCVKTPEGKIWKPPHDDATDDLGCTQLPNAELECVHAEGGYGPISVLLKKMLPGRYHVFAKCNPYKMAKGDVGWAQSNAQLTFFGGEQESLGWSGPTHFTHPKEGEAPWWDICFLDVDARGCVKVRSFNELKADEPGNRLATIVCKDINGRPVEGVKVLCQADSTAGSQETDETDKEGKLQVLLALAQYTVKVEKPGYINTAVRLTVDLEPTCAEVVVPMVKPEVFSEGQDSLLCVLSWGGKDIAEMHVETPGRLLKRPKTFDEEFESYELPMTTPMQMRGNNPKSVLLSRPSQDPAVCMEGIEDKLYVYFKGGRLDDGTGLDLCNMQLSIYSFKEGMEAKFNPPSLLEQQENDKPLQHGNYWEIATIKGGTVDANSLRSDTDPASGGTYAVRVLPAKEGEQEFPPFAQVTIKSTDGDRLIRKFIEPPAPDTVDFSQDQEYSLFLNYGRYTIEASDEDKWWGPLPAENIVYARNTQPSLALTMVHKPELNAAAMFISLSWSQYPADLDLCLRCQDGVVSSATKLDNKTTPVKQVKYEACGCDGFGPKTISISQQPTPMSAKFKVYVTNKEAKAEGVSFLQCNPIITMTLSGGVWKQFQLKKPEGWQTALEENKEEIWSCWHVCDLHVSSGPKMDDTALEMFEINKLSKVEPGNDGA